MRYVLRSFPFSGDCAWKYVSYSMRHAHSHDTNDVCVSPHFRGPCTLLLVVRCHKEGQRRLPVSRRHRTQKVVGFFLILFNLSQMQLPSITCGNCASTRTQIELDHCLHVNCSHSGGHPVHLRPTIVCQLRCAVLLKPGLDRHNHYRVQSAQFGLLFRSDRASSAILLVHRQPSLTAELQYLPRMSE